MSDGYTVFWTQDRCRLLRQAGQAGTALKVLFGGPHQSHPRFSQFGVKPGDCLYPVHVMAGVFHVLGRMRVKRLLTVEEYVAANPRRFAGFADPACPGAALDR